MGERRIPHLRDIFSLGSGANQATMLPSQPITPQCDSALGSGEEDELPQDDSKKKSKSKGKGKEKEKQNDVKHLERHLSMKKTIRKKIMRELQQAWVEDPTEFKVEDVPREKLGAELRLESLSYGRPKSKRKNNSSFLEFLRGQGKDQKEREDDGDSGCGGSPTRNTREDEDDEKSGFWKRLTARRNKR